TMFELDGPRAFSSLKLRVPGVVATPTSEVWDILNGTWIRIYWDNESNPSVSAPLGSFFGIGQFSTYRAKSLAAGMDDSSALYIYFPMPFEKRARIELFNSRGVALNGISYEIKHKAFASSFAQVGYFKTQFNNQVHTGGDGTDVRILDTPGAGHFVGVVLSILGEANRMYLEGDERIYIDDNRSPAIHGTGTEDFFNAGWYYRGGPFSLPVHGLAANVHDASFDRTAQYRLFLADAIPFHKHLTVGIEHGQTNDVSEEAWALAYYYHKPTPRAILTDTLDVGNAASESSHEYVIANATWSGEHSYSYEGVAEGMAIGDTGRAHKGYSQFAMAIQPANDGVILRRRLDYGVGNQNTDVYVDGARVGSWYRAGSNSARWRDDDFMIPASFTKGKSKITIRVVFVSSDSDWNEFTYWVYSLTSQ
ncbi:MAG: glycoside hydrolase family 172 protein, partial [Chloroflexota bacterium]